MKNSFTHFFDERSGEILHNIKNVQSHDFINAVTCQKKTVKSIRVISVDERISRSFAESSVFEENQKEILAKHPHVKITIDCL